MSSILEAFDYPPSEKVTFWDEQPKFRIIKEFEEIYNIDKGKKKSSNIMWAIAFLCEMDPTVNPVAYVAEEEKKERIKDDFLKDNKFNWEDKTVKAAIITYKKLVLTQAERSLADWEDMMVKRDKFLKKTKYDLTTMSALDTAHKATPALFKSLELVKETLKAEIEKEKLGAGGKTKSLADTGEI